MEPVVLALASNEHYFPGLQCAVASALSYLDSTREVDLKVLDGGLSPESRSTLSRLIERFGECVRLEFVTADPSVFSKATLGPGKSHMTYCRTLLPQLLNVPRLIYLDCDVLVFRDLAKLFRARSRHRRTIRECISHSPRICRNARNGELLLSR